MSKTKEMPSDTKTINRGVWFSVMALGVFLSLVWYRNFEISQIDNGETLTFMKMFRDPSLYPDSFLLKQLYGIHLYSVYYWIAGEIGRLGDPFWGLFGYFVVINCVCIAGLFSLSLAITRNAGAAVLATLALVLQWQWSYALGGSASLGVGPYPDQLATGLLLFSLACFIEKRFLPGFLLAGATFNIHASFSFYVLFMYSVCLAVSGDWKKLFQGGFAAFLAALPMLIYMAIHPLPASTISFANWYHLLHLRSTGHTLPLHFSFASKARFLPYPFLFLFGYRASLKVAAAEDRERLRTVLTLTMGMLILLVIGTVFAEWIPVETVIKLTTFRSCRFFVIFATILYVRYAWPLLSEGSLQGFLHITLTAALLSAALPFQYALLLMVFLLDEGPKGRVYGAVVLVILGSIAVYAWRRYGMAGVLEKSNLILFLADFVVLIAVSVSLRRSAKKRTVLALGSAGLLLLTVLSPTIPEYSNREYFQALKEIQLWLKDNTPSGKPVIFPPSAYIWSGLSERGDTFSYTEISYPIYADFLTAEVFKRSKDYVDDILSFQDRDVLQKAFNTSFFGWSGEKILSVGEKYQAEYAVVPLGMTYPFKLCYENSLFRVYKLSKN